MPSEPLFAPVSVKRSSLSEPVSGRVQQHRLRMPRMALHRARRRVVAGDDSTSGFFFSKIGSAASKSSIAFFFAAKLPSSPYLSVYL